jgi:hypothetical protein
MSLAMDSASKAAVRLCWIGAALALCAADLGCVGTSAARREAPRPGGLARLRRVRMPGSLWSHRSRSDEAPRSALAAAAPQRRTPSPTAPESRTVVHSTAPPPGAVLPAPRPPDRPVAVALQPPRTAAEAERPDLAAAPKPPPATRPHVPGEALAGTQAEAPQARTAAGLEPAEDGLEEVAALVASARARLDAIGTYQVRLTRQERVGGELQPIEDVLLSIRRRPKAVRLEWTDGPHKGREVLYSATENGGLMHVKMAASLVPPLALAPDSPLALRTSRHPITEAGLDTVLDRLETALTLSRQKDPAAGVVTDGGPETPEELGRPCRKLVRKQPDGETWVVYLDAKTQLPALVRSTAANGELLEKYLFRDVKTELPELASADAFDPGQRWGRAAGVLGRLARAAGSTPGTPDPAVSR